MLDELNSQQNSNQWSIKRENKEKQKQKQKPYNYKTWGQGLLWNSIQVINKMTTEMEGRSDILKDTNSGWRFLLVSSISLSPPFFLLPPFPPLFSPLTPGSLASFQCFGLQLFCSHCSDTRRAHVHSLIVSHLLEESREWLDTQFSCYGLLNITARYLAIKQLKGKYLNTNLPLFFRLTTWEKNSRYF